MSELCEFKIKYLQKLASIDSFSSSWQVWRPLVLKHLGSSPTGQDIFDLGDHLSDIFQANASKGRAQSQLSGGGAAWECLVSWYLNFVLWSTPVAVVRQHKSYVPSVINDMLTITISNNQTNTESDVVIFSVPEVEDLNSTKLEDLDSHLKNRLADVTLVNLQCKTNWNDNAQVPMLWDMIYNSDSRLPNVSTGVNGVTPQSVGTFRYAFATVPTTSMAKISPNSVCVLRVKNLTGGNYWGQKTKGGVASSIKELTTRNFGTFFDGGVAQTLNRQIQEDPTYISQFLDLDWTEAEITQ